MNLFDLSNDVAVVIGGTGSLGGGMADALASAGAKVAVLGRSAERGNARVQALEAMGVKAMFQSTDVLDPESLKQARDAIVKTLGTPTILINAAGGNRPDATLPPGSDFCKLTLEAWNGVFDLNLVGGTLLPSQVFGETMLQAGTRKHHQHRIDVGNDPAVAGGSLLRCESCRHQPDAISWPANGRPRVYG